MTRKSKKNAQSFELNKQEKNQQEKERINTIITEDVTLIAKNESQKNLLKSIKENQITICNGVAGSGKTICSIYMALTLLQSRANSYRKIYLVKSVTVLKGEELGFLKGELREKVDPFIESFRINAEKLFRFSNVRALFETSIIEFLPLAYIRGRNFDNCIVILDETQNVSIDNARTLMTRIGEDCKIICLGDTNQVDLRIKKESALAPMLKVFNDVEDIKCVQMDENEENCRNPIIKIIEQKFKTL